jgi:hypothetical protein
MDIEIYLKKTHTETVNKILDLDYNSHDAVCTLSFRLD